MPSLSLTNVTFTFNAEFSLPAPHNTNGLAPALIYMAYESDTNTIVLLVTNGTSFVLTDMTSKRFRTGVVIPAWTVYAERGTNWPSGTFTNAMRLGKFEWTATDTSGRTLVSDTNESIFYGYGDYPRYTLREYDLTTAIEDGILYGRYPQNIIGADAVAEEMMWMLQQSVTTVPGSGGGPPYGKPPYIKGVTGPFRMEVVDVVGAYEQYITQHTVNGTTTTTTNTTDDTGFILYTLYPTNESEFISISVTNVGVFPANSSIHNPPTGGTNWPGGP